MRVRARFSGGYLPLVKMGVWASPPREFRHCLRIYAANADGGAYRQLDKIQFDNPTQGILLAAADRPHRGSTATEAAWFELETLLASTVPADVVYAIRKLDAMSIWEGRGSHDFDRDAALEAIRPFVLSADKAIAETASGAVARDGRSGVSGR